MPATNLIPLVGLHFGHSTLTEHDDLPVNSARIGCPVWTRSAFLANLELRLGLPSPAVTPGVRDQRWSRRLSELSSTSRFYSRSYAVDPLGTAQGLLAWRDALVEAGWDGEAIPGGGERLNTFCELERDAALPPGMADRERLVEATLRSSAVRPFAEVALAEPREAWPGRFRRIFALLEERGIPVRTVEPVFPVTEGESDLGRLQASLRGEGRGGGGTGLRGDGSLVLVRGETSWELAQGVASLVAAWAEASSVVIRGGEAHALDLALTARGLASQGVASRSSWRPLLQVLPLAIELAFEPRDPHRVLELLTLPTGPFAGVVGRELAGALAEAPGIGGRPWLRAKESIVLKLREWAAREARARGTDEAEAMRLADADGADRLARVAHWLEHPGHDAVAGAPRGALVDMAARVQGWLQGRLSLARKQADANPEDVAALQQVALLGSAFGQALALREALSHEPRETLDLVAARQLVEDAGAGGHTLNLAVERAGRMDHVDGPADLRCPRDLVVWWHAVSGTEPGPGTDPWRKAERDALVASGIPLLGPATRLAAGATHFRHALLSARKRLVLAVPSWSHGERHEPHAVWDEIVARLSAEPPDVARVTLDARDLLEGRARVPGLDAVLPTAELTPLALPEARPTWKLDGAHLGPASRHSASSLGSLVGCPLQWVLRYPGGVRAGRAASIPGGPLLTGKLGHRLVEELHRAGALADPTRVLAEAAPLLRTLIREEAAVLLAPGKVFELVQLERKLLEAAHALSVLLLASGLSVMEAETNTVVAWGSRELDGRLDLLLRDRDGRDVVLDLKWGGKTYSELLKSGLATQLAAYAAVRQLSTGAVQLPVAAYFSLASGRVLTTEVGPFAGTRVSEGPRMSETWASLQRTLQFVEDSLQRGEVPVTGIRRSLPLLESIGVAPSERGGHLAIPAEGACKYCEHDSLCGKRWEAFS